jgi:hypothetical protein
MSWRSQWLMSEKVYEKLFCHLKTMIREKQRINCLQELEARGDKILTEINLSFFFNNGTVSTFSLGLDYMDYIFAFVNDYYDMTINDSIKE